MYQYEEISATRMEDVRKLYQLQGWLAYLSDGSKLQHAFEKSLYVLGALRGDRLVGFIRCVGDGEHVLLIQDLIVAPKERGRGVGSRLLESVLERYSSVRQILVVTDSADEAANRFYRHFGLRELRQRGMTAYTR